MSLENELTERSGGKCELCGGAQDALEILSATKDNVATADEAIFVCPKCSRQIKSTEILDVNHWRCLNDSAWSQVPAIQVTAWRTVEPALQ